MAEPDAALTTELVRRYIKSAQPFVESKTDRLVLQRAIRLNAPPTKHRRQKNPRGKFIGTINAAADKDAVKVESLESAIWAEIHAALCKRTARYRKNVDVIRDNVHLLIGGIAVHVAEKFGLAVAIVAAVVAALLRIVLQMGVTVFCKRFKSGFL
jgi:uncharacterized membrane-anchored protein